MSKVNVSPEEFGDLVVAFILDKLLNPEEVIEGNKAFNEFMEKLSLKGVKPLALNYYLKCDANLRVKYKRIKKVFEYDQNQAAIINIFPSEREKEEVEKKDSFIKRAIKKILRRENIDNKEEKLLEEFINEGGV